MDEDDSNALVPMANTAVDKFNAGLTRFLDDLDLPSKDVLAAGVERRTVFQVLPTLVDRLTIPQRTVAMYLSKVVVACGAGLFDAALNYIWDEVVVRLRERVVRFDLNYFFDTAIKDPEARKQFRSEDDLQRMSDADLISGALNCGFITNLAYKHLDHIRDMRNWASAAHPNSAQLTGLQLATYCETCIKEVILKEPSGPVLEVTRLLKNLREQVLAKRDVPGVVGSIRRLPADLAAALLRALAGYFCDPRIEVKVRDNVRLIAPDAWQHAPDAARGEIGLRYSSYSANADIDRKSLAHEFLEMVGGLTALPDSDRALEIALAAQQLDQTHDAMNNFYNEPPAARQLRKYVGDDGAIPQQVNSDYVKVVARCRIGRRSGIAHNAVPIYEEMIDLFQEPQVRAFVEVLSDARIAARLDDAGCARRFRELATKLLAKTVDKPLRRVLEAAIGATDAQLPKLAVTTAFKKLVDVL
jgi:hypothetical protein